MVKWVNDQRICAIWTLRSQNVSLISFCDAGPWHCQTVNVLTLKIEKHFNFLMTIQEIRCFEYLAYQNGKVNDAVSWQVSTIESGLKGWLDVGADMLFHPDGNSFLHLAPVQIDHTEEYFTNIVMVDAVKRHSWPVTQYKSEIHRLLGWDTSNGRNLV